MHFTNFNREKCLIRTDNSKDSNKRHTNAKVNRNAPESAFQRRSSSTRRFPRRSSIDPASSPRATAIANSAEKVFPAASLSVSKEVRMNRHGTMRISRRDTATTRSLAKKKISCPSRFALRLIIDTCIWANS